MKPIDLTITHERMSDIFMKHHVHGLPFDAVFHHFTGVDTGPPHNHPWAFTTHILSGGYVEEQYIWFNDKIGYITHKKERLPGTSHRVLATDIHKVVELLAGECWTIILPEPREQKPGFLVDNIIKPWDEYLLETK